MTKQEIAVESGTAQSLAAEASSRGKTLYSFTNQILDVALRVFGQGGDASEILPAWKSYRVTKDIEGVPFLPRSLVWKMVERLYQRDPEWLLQEWFEAGRRIGEVLRTFHPTLEDLQVGMTGNPSIMTEQRIEIMRPRSAGDGRQQVRLRVVTDLTPELASCGESLLHGLLCSYSFRATESHVEDGVVEVVAVYEGQAPVPAAKPETVDVGTSRPNGGLNPGARTAPL